MSWRPRSHALAIATLAFLTLAALTPLAVADHAYSHRYIVYGRVIDAEDNPVRGLTVDLGYEAPFKAEGACGGQPGTETEAFGPTQNQPVTNAVGEFMFCFHTHGLSRGTPGTGIIRIADAGVEERVTFDGFMRYSFVPIKLANAHPGANKTAADTLYTIMGRAWEATDSEIKVEGVGVWGNTLHNKPFTITTNFEGEDPQTFTGTTNNYGDFAIRVPVSGRPSGGTVTLAIEGHNFTADVDPAVGTTHIRAQVGELKTTPGASLLALVGVVAVAALLMRRRG